MIFDYFVNGRSNKESSSRQRGMNVIGSETQKRCKSTLREGMFHIISRGVILEPENIGPWLLDGGTELLKPAPEDALRMWPVSKRVGKPGNPDDATLIEPIVVDPAIPDSRPGLLLH
jgi:hypothetical protein